MKKTILIFNGYYIPAKNYGGPTTSIVNLVKACSNFCDFRLVVLNHDFADTRIYSDIKPGWNKIGEAQVLYVDDKDFTVMNIVGWISECKADLMYLGGVFSIRNLHYLKAANKANIPVIVPPRGELCTNALKVKAYKKVPFLFFLRLFRVYSKVYFHATSLQEEIGIRKYLDIDKKNIYLIPNIPKTVLRKEKQHKVINEIKVVSISRICRTKNVLTAIKVINLINYNAVFHIYGPIEDIEYWRECENEIKKSPANVSIKYCGELPVENVCETFTNYDCFLFPTITENYGHSIVESMLSGCPVIISRGTTPWDDVNENGGFTGELANIDTFVNVVNKVAEMDNNTYKALVDMCIVYINKKVDFENIKNQYISMFYTIGDTKKSQ